MSQQEPEDSGFLSGYLSEVEQGGKDKQRGGGLGSFLQKELSEEERFEKTDSYSPSIFFHSSEDMRELDDESVHFAITSPPYNTGWSYGSYDDSLEYATEYLPMLARVFREVYRVLVPGGRFAVNVPSLLRDGPRGGFPIAADITRMMITGANIALMPTVEGEHWQADSQSESSSAFHRLHVVDWRMREQIAWFKDFNTDGLAPNGSFPRPWGILLNNMHEVIMVFQKPGQRDFSDMGDDVIERSKINKRDSDMCDDVWFINPSSWSPKHTDEDIPVFPDKLVRRAIRLWSYEGDTVLDPFAGRFTTGKVAKEERRHGVGYELREDLKEDIERYTNKYETGLFQFMEE